MQIPNVIGNFNANVLPVTSSQGALLSQTVSQAGELAGSTSFAPIEALSSSDASRPAPEQWPFQQQHSPPEHDSPSPHDSPSEQDASSLQDETPAHDRAGAPVSSQPRVEAEAEAQKLADSQLIQQLSQRHKEVQAHEQAHASIGGDAAGGAHFQYQRGPDGVNYAVSGEVSIDTSAVANDPQATLKKMMQIQRAALAPIEPSAQDRQVAAQAAQQAWQARGEMTAASSSILDAQQDERQADVPPANTRLTSHSESSESPQNTFWKRDPQTMNEQPLQAKEPGSGASQSLVESNLSRSAQATHIVEQFHSQNQRLVRINRLLNEINQGYSPEILGVALDDRA